jgi:hypothetical protein
VAFAQIAEARVDGGADGRDQPPEQHRAALLRGRDEHSGHGALARHARLQQAAEQAFTAARPGGA